MIFMPMVTPEDGGMDSKMNCTKCIFFNSDALGCMITDFQRKNIKVDGKKLPCMLNKSDNNKIEPDVKYEIIKEYYV